MSQPLLRIHLHGRKKQIPRSPGGKARIDLTAREAGQIIVIFALMLTVLIGLVGIAIDLTYAWRMGFQIQRSADAGALAGVVYLPGDKVTAHDRAVAEVGRNGFSSAGGAAVTAAPNPNDDRQLDVSVTTQVPTFFVRIFGVDHWTISRRARAAFVMPVPLGSPLSYFGVGCLVLSGTPPPGCNSTGTGTSGVTTNGTSGGTSLGSLGAWGAVITKGGNQENGDAYSPRNDGGSSNVSYDTRGYFYTAVLPAGGSIKVFDPGFCEMGDNGSGGFYGTGDHWIDDVGGAYNSVYTYFTLWDTHNVPLNPNGWTKTGHASGTLFENQKGKDGGAHGSGACDAYHNKWWTLASGLASGTYEVEVSTTNPANASINSTTNAENMWAIQATGGGSTQVYGYDKMAVYNNLAATGVSQKFYMAKVDRATGAGKTLTIDLFDIGDSTAGYIRIWSPDKSATQQKMVTNFNYHTYNRTATGGRTSPGNCASGKSDTCSGNGRSKITVKTSSGSSFNNTWTEITIPLGSDYGDKGLWEGGWWQVEYVVTGGNDTTTWSVNVNGNPVHLVPVFI